MSKPQIHIYDDAEHGKKCIRIGPNAKDGNDYWIGVDLCKEMASLEPKAVLELVRLLVAGMKKHFTRMRCAKRIIVPTHGMVRVEPRIVASRN